MNRFLVILLTTAAMAPSSSAFSLGNNKLAKVQVEPFGLADGFHVQVQAADQEYRLQLKKPETSIFAPGFKFTILEINEKGEQVFVDATPTREELQAIERHTYLDASSNSVLNVREAAEGQYRVDGMIHNMQITHHEDDRHLLSPPEAVPMESAAARINDYVDLHRNLTEGPMTRQAVSTANPEVLILFDYANYQQFSGNVAAMNDYLSVFYHAINNRFATITNSKITAAVSGVLAFNSRSAQPFIEESKIPDGTAYDMNTVLDKLSYWAYSNRNGLAKHDVASLISAEPFKAKDSKGAYVSGIAGLAYMKGACWTYGNSRFLGTSVNADKGGFWNGVMTAAHELAHNLGAPHDGDSGAGTCPWSGGYIMSYEGWGTKNKFYFSSCSQSLMKGFIDSAEGACVRSYQAPSRWTLSNDNPGDRLDMTAQCRKHLNRNDATAETEGRTPADICRNLKCRVPVSATSYSIYTLNRVPGDLTPCGTNLVCWNGDCVAKTAPGK